MRSMSRSGAGQSQVRQRKHSEVADGRLFEHGEWSGRFNVEHLSRSGKHGLKM